MNFGRASLRGRMSIALFGGILASLPAVAQETINLPSSSNYGGVGILDTRTARFFPDGYLVLSTSFTQPDTRYAVTFQALPWAELTFRYSINRGFPSTDATKSLHDRSFDIKVRLSNEDELLPEIALGFQDVIGTGAYSGEYLVASKRWREFDFSLGVGWGRLATRGTFQNPFQLISNHFATDRSSSVTEGGIPLFNSYFRGPDMGLFGGVTYDTPIEHLKVKVEYTSDTYERERLDSGRDYSYPWNFGISYQAWSWLDVGLSLMHGREIGLRVAAIIDPASEIWPVRLDRAPRFRARPKETASTILSRNLGSKGSIETQFVDLTAQRNAESAVSDQAQARDKSEAPLAMSSVPEQVSTETKQSSDAAIRAAIGSQRISITGLSIENDKVCVVVENGRYRRDSEVFARTARALSAAAPTEVEYFEITLLKSGVPVTTLTLLRTDIDKLARAEGSAAELFYVSELRPSSSAPLDHIDPGLFPAFGLSAYPVFRQSLFDPDNPFYVELGVGATAGLRVARNLFLEGSATASLYDDFNDIQRTSDSVLPHVRSDFAEYLKQGKYRIESLMANYYFKLSPVVFGRASVGYLEWMFAGAGGELLYRPFGRRWSLGADLWFVRQRGFDGLLDLRHYQTITGHLSAYYKLPWHDIQISASAGQYLAGDKGVTFEAFRRFSTGVEIGAWFTLTNISAAQFGEGSFDKGIRIYIPFEWAAPFSTRSGYELNLRPIQRDGGQSLIGDRVLYRTTDGADYGAISGEWNSVFSDARILP